jgi:hypothetical protein
VLVFRSTFSYSARIEVERNINKAFLVFENSAGEAQQMPTRDLLHLVGVKAASYFVFGFFFFLYRMLGLTQKFHGATQLVFNAHLSYRYFALITCNVIRLQKVSYSLNLYEGTVTMMIEYNLLLHPLLCQTRNEFCMRYIFTETVALQRSPYSRIPFPTVLFFSLGV